MQVLEIGQVGKAGAAAGQNYSFYAHSQREAPFGDAASVVKALQHAAKHANKHASYLNVSSSLYRATMHLLDALVHAGNGIHETQLNKGHLDCSITVKQQLGHTEVLPWVEAYCHRKKFTRVKPPTAP